MRFHGGLLACLGALILLAVLVPGTEGKARLDKGFGDAGFVSFDGGQRLYTLATAGSVAETKGGRLVVLSNDSGYGGRTVLVGLRPDGGLDRDFADQGMLISRELPPLTPTSPGNRWGFGADLASGKSGRIVTAGTVSETDNCESQIFLSRIFPGGGQDRSFGLGGSSRACFRQPAGKKYVGVVNNYPLEARSVALAGKGRILVAGTTIRSRHKSGAFVARFRANGKLDPTFRGRMKVKPRSRGIVEVLPGRARGIDGYSAWFEEVKPLRRQRVLAVGSMNRTFTVVRFLANGRIDRSFGRRGKVMSLFDTTREAGGSYATGVAFDRKGRILVAGFYAKRQTIQNGFALVMRLTRDGRPDRSFGRRGVARIRVGGPMTPTGIAIQDDGRIVVAGSSDGRFAVARLNPNGSPDRTFFKGGLYARPGSKVPGIATDVMIDSKGRIVAVGGASEWYSDEGITAVRILP